MSEINTSLDQFNQMVENSETSEETMEGSEEFKKYFYDLLKQVIRLQNLIQLYNEKLSTQP